MQGFHRYRDHAQSFARMLKFPARDGNHSIRPQVIKIFAKCLDGI